MSSRSRRWCLGGWTLAFKLHVGWREILDHDWGGSGPLDAPSIEGMSWTDVLPQEIWELTPELGGRPEQLSLVPSTTTCVPMPDRGLMRQAEVGGGS